MTDTTIPSSSSQQRRWAQESSQRWPLQKADAAEILTVTFALFALTVVAGWLITGVMSSSPLGAADASVNTWFESVRTSTWNTLTDWGSSFSDTITIVLLLAVLIPGLRFVTGRWHGSVLLAGAVAVETLVFVTGSLVVGRERPPVEQLDMSPPTASFPSGHTGAAVAFYIGLIVVVFWWTNHRPTRIAAAAIFGAIPVIVGLSRLYRGMHYPTDVLFGALIGLASVALFARLIMSRNTDEKAQREEARQDETSRDYRDSRVEENAR